MSRGNSISTWRPIAVWALASTATTAAVLALPGAWQVAGRTTDFADLLVAVCASALAGSLVWLWVITTTTVAGLLTGRRGGWRVGATRRLVLVACGAAVAAGPALPALAAGGGGAEVLAGLALPDRATAPVVPGDYVVRPGDSLWSIAGAHPEAGTDVDARWRAIWRANHDVVGDDPDLILPGQALRLPGTPRADGDRR